MDGDQIPARIDNCPTIANPEQRDADQDGTGDLCDPDFAPYQPPEGILATVEPDQVPDASNDTFTVTTSNTVVLDVTLNDPAIPDNPQVIIVDGPDAGSAQVDGIVINYTAPDTPGTTTINYLLRGQICAQATATITIEPEDTEPPRTVCPHMTIDSFGTGPWYFTFQIRNATPQSRDFEFEIPDANYTLDNLQFNGSGQNLNLDQTNNPDGTTTITINGTVPPYQSVGAQQPNGFGGTLNPTNGPPTIYCQP